MNINKTWELEQKTTNIESQVVESKMKQQQKDEEIMSIKEYLKSEVEKLRSELKKRPAQVMIYPSILKKTESRLHLREVGKKILSSSLKSANERWRKLVAKWTTVRRYIL